MPFARKLYPMVKRILGDEEETRDAVQELMIRYWDKRHTLEKCENREGYMAVAARNYCLDLKKKRKIPVSGNLENSHDPMPATEQDLETREKMGHLHQIIEQLPEKYREVLQLREIDGFSFSEIQEITGFEQPYIRVLLSRSRCKVREEMEKIYNYEKIGYHIVG